MIFYRYQNTKTLERNSQYVDMRALYNEVIYRRDYSFKNINITVDFLVDNLYAEFSEELIYRKNLEQFQYRTIIKKVCEIAIDNEKEGLTSEEKSKQRKEAYDKIDKLMSNYPLKGIFVVPEYNEEFEEGTQYSIPELRSKVISKLNVESVKYLAIYKGDVIKKEMKYGGTLICPTKILGVLDLYCGANEKSQLIIEPMYRHIKDNKKLQETISKQKELMALCIRNNTNKSVKDKIRNSHLRELIILKLLHLTNADYNKLQYRYIEDKHLIEINKANTTYKYCIFNKDVTLQNILNNDLIKYEGYCITDDFFNNTKKRESLNMTIAV